MNSTPDIFLSIVLVVQNQQQNLERILRSTSDVAKACAQDHEIVVIDNGSEDGSVGLLRTFCGEDGIPNLQVYVLTKKTEKDIAAWAGVSNALGDYVAVVDPESDDIHALPSLLTASTEGVDVVFAKIRNAQADPIGHRIAERIFGITAKRLLGIDTSREMPFYRVLSRKVVNYMSRYNSSGLAYRWLPSVSGFSKTSVLYESSVSQEKPRHNLLDRIDRGTRMLVSSTFGPMRIVTLLSLFGAAVNLLYSVYVIMVAIFKDDVEPGWVTLSLQQSGMFFLISLVLLVLGEYILHMARLGANAPSYYIADEFTSAVITRHQRLNVEENTKYSPAENLQQTKTTA